MNRLIACMIALTFLFSTVDALLTIRAVEMGIAYEANPFMAYFYGISPLVFFLVKTLIIGASSIFFWKKREVAASRYAVVFGLVVYSAIIGWHLHGLIYFYE